MRPPSEPHKALMAQQLKSWLDETQGKVDAAKTEHPTRDPLFCLCGRELRFFHGRSSGLYRILHTSSAGRCRHEFRSWVGKTPQEALELFGQWKDSATEFEALLEAPVTRREPTEEELEQLNAELAG